MRPQLSSRLQELFAENFTQHGDIGASVSVWQHGREVFSAAAGHRDRDRTLPWTADTRILAWSATKGVAAGTFLAVMEEEHIGLDRRVAEFWPSFAAAGKGQITLAELLSHQAGLCGVRTPGISILDHDGVAAALAAQALEWPPGQGSGYHTRTFGFLLDEILRRLTGRSLAKLWRELFGDPLQLDFWIGLPPELVEDTAPVFPARNPGNLNDDPFWRAMADPESLTRLAFNTPGGLPGVASMNTPAAHLAEIPSMGGIGTAQALAKWYAVLANGGQMDGRRFVSKATIATMSTPLVSGPDVVLLQPLVFSAGFMQDPVGPDGRKTRQLFGPSTSAFGHPGAGGSHAFADPENELSFAYLMNQMEIGSFPNAKSLRLVEAIYAGLEAD